MDYAGETYAGSAVSIRDVQRVALEMLCAVDRVCKQNDIPYQLFAGTLLGAVRHQGFIPWDDDIDIAILRSDWDRFAEACARALDGPYFLQTYETDPEYDNQYAKIRKHGTLFRERPCADAKMHHGIFIDVFCLDTVKPGTLAGELQRGALCLLRRLRMEAAWRPRRRRHRWTAPLHALLGLPGRLLGKRRLDRLDTRVSKWFACDASPWLNHIQIKATRKHCRRFLMSKPQFLNTTPMVFEGRTFPGPVEFHPLLTQAYGDYMRWPPEEERRPRHAVAEVSLSVAGH
jgi:lipopolysaccharide cholinephosphotransferase